MPSQVPAPLPAPPPLAWPLLSPLPTGRRRSRRHRWRRWASGPWRRGCGAVLCSLPHRLPGLWAAGIGLCAPAASRSSVYDAGPYGVGTAVACSGRRPLHGLAGVDLPPSTASPAQLLVGRGTRVASREVSRELPAPPPPPSASGGGGGPLGPFSPLCACGACVVVGGVLPARRGALCTMVHGSGPMAARPHWSPSRCIAPRAGCSRPQLSPSAAVTGGSARPACAVSPPVSRPGPWTRGAVRRPVLLVRLRQGGAGGARRVVPYRSSCPPRSGLHPRPRPPSAPTWLPAPDAGARAWPTGWRGGGVSRRGVRPPCHGVDTVSRVPCPVSHSGHPQAPRP